MKFQIRPMAEPPTAPRLPQSFPESVTKLILGAIKFTTMLAVETLIIIPMMLTKRNCENCLPCSVFFLSLKGPMLVEKVAEDDGAKK